MKFFIFLIFAIIVLFIYKKSMAKIDADEKKALNDAKANRSTSYWENYKKNNPRKASEILELTHINMEKETDMAVREIVGSIERWSANAGKPIAELKKDCIISAINLLGNDDFELLIEKIKKTEMAKEAARFGIDKDHTISRFMIEFYDEYMQQKKLSQLEEHFKNTIPGFDPDAVRKTMEELNLAPDISNLNNKENRLIDLIKECSDKLSTRFKTLSHLGRCEAILFFSTQVMDYGQLQNNIDMDLFEDRFKLLLYDEVACEFDKSDIFGFLNSRVKFYKEEYAKMRDNCFYLPIALYNAFYINPGCDNPNNLETVDNTADVNSFSLHILKLVIYIKAAKNSI